MVFVSALLVLHNPPYSSGVLVLCHVRVTGIASVYVSCLFLTPPNFLDGGFGLSLCEMAFGVWISDSCFMFFVPLLTRNISLGARHIYGNILSPVVF